MLVTAFEIVGLRGADGLRRDGLERVETLPSGQAGVAVADALTLLSGSMDRRRLEASLTRLGIVRPSQEVEVLEEDRLPVQVSWPEGYGVSALLAPESQRAIRVQVELQPDPPFYGRLRDLAVRDPRLVTALGQYPSLRIEIGWLFTRDLTTAAVSIQHLQVGDVGFPMSGKDRPLWLGIALPDLGSRFGRVDENEPIEAVAGRLHEASLSSDPEQRARFDRVAESLAKPPFSLGHLELVRLGDGVDPCFGPQLVRARQLGPAAADALRLVTAVQLDAPDVLVVEAPGRALLDRQAVRDWLGAATAGDGATLEQVLFAEGGAEAAE